LSIHLKPENLAVVRSGVNRLAGVGFANFFNIGKIAQSARRQFRSNEVTLGNEKGRDPTLRVDHALDSPGPCLIEIYAVDAGKDIDRDWLPSEADEFQGIR